MGNFVVALNVRQDRAQRLIEQLDDLSQSGKSLYGAPQEDVDFVGSLARMVLAAANEIVRSRCELLATLPLMDTLLDLADAKLKTLLERAMVP